VSVKYVAQRLVHGVLVLWIVATAVFFLFRVIPGDPAAMTLGFDAPPQALAAVRAEMGLDRPLHVQYASWLFNLLRWDLGRSPTNGNAPVASLVFPSLWRTLELASLSMLVGVSIALPLGMLSALRVGSSVDQLARVVTTIGFSMPTYVLGIVALLVFAEMIPLLPSAGYVPPTEDLVLHLKHLILPAASVGFVMAARLARFMRAGMLDVLSQDYVRTAYAKGVPGWRVNARHALPNAMLAFVTEVGVNFGLLLGGMVVIEQVFAWPGLGWLMIQSTLNRAYDVVQVAVLFSAAAFVIVNLAVDLSYCVLDPRIAYE
jgi:peptide/nickel transport system permease protein